MEPFKTIDNVYFVGTKEASSHLIVTEDGLILIDTGYEETADAILLSVEKLGFDIQDVKIILFSHGHRDHTGGTKKILEKAPNAKTYINFNDIKYLKNFTPDFNISDGDVIRLGKTEILCLFTPGHTEGSVSFFLDVYEDGKKYRAAMFGGSGTNQLRRGVLHRQNVPYLCRGLFVESVKRLLEIPVDVMLGNHTWQSKTFQKLEKIAKGYEGNPFIDPKEWGKYLNSLLGALKRAIEKDAKECFINYAHRGASEYYPENTMSAFEAGVRMGASGIETDVRKTKDGVLVLFHDQTLERLAGRGESICDLNYSELSEIFISKGDTSDRIPTLEEFLERFRDCDLMLAIELKCPGIEGEVASAILRHGVEKRTFVTSFELDWLENLKKYNKVIRASYLAPTIDDDVLSRLVAMGADEVCPRAKDITPELCEKLHGIGFNVRAYGVGDEEMMKSVYRASADGMTINFPDKLADFLREEARLREEAAAAEEKAKAQAK